MNQQFDTRLLVTQGNRALVFVKLQSGGQLVLTADEANDLAQQLLNIAQAARDTNDSTS